MSVSLETVALVVGAVVLGPEILAVAGEGAAGAALAEAGAVEVAGEIAIADFAAADFAMTEVAANPVLTAAADASVETLSTMASTLDSTSALTIVDTATAVEQGTAVLEATGTTAATAGADAAAAQTIIEAGGTVEQATTAATLTSEGSTVAEAVTASTEGAVTANPITEVLSAPQTDLPSTLESMSEGAKNFTKSIGETLLPDADPMLQKAAGQVAINTATNGGDFEKALENTAISLGTGVVGSEVASETGSKLAGQAAATAAKQVAQTGDFDLSKFGTQLAGTAVGSEVAQDTESPFAGKVASTITTSALQGKDPLASLTNLGVGELVKQGVDTATNLFGQPTTETETPPEEPKTLGGEAPDTVQTTETQPVGGLNQVSQDMSQVHPEWKNLAAATITKPLIQNVMSSQPVMRPTQPTGLNAASKATVAQQVASTKPMQPAPRVDVSTLQPIKQGQFQPVTAPTKVDVTKLTPITNTASLSSILAGLKKKG